MRLGVLFNCQHQMLADVLRLVQPAAEVVDYDIGQLLLDEGRRDAALAELMGCEHVLSLYLGEENGPLGSHALHAILPRLTILPGFSFGGFHPDTIYVHTPQGFLEGFTHHYHSRIALAGYLSGRPAHDTARLYNALVMGRAGYFDAYAQEQSLVCQVFEKVGIDLNPLFASWAAAGCFMHSVNHPKPACYVDVALALLRYAGLAGAQATVDASLVRDTLRFHPTHPVLPPLARRLGVPAELGFKPYHPSEDHSVPLQRFVELQFERFPHVARHELEAAPGVLTLLSVLG